MFLCTRKFEGECQSRRGVGTREMIKVVLHLLWLATELAFVTTRYSVGIGTERAAVGSQTPACRVLRTHVTYNMKYCIKVSILSRPCREKK